MAVHSARPDGHLGDRVPHHRVVVTGLGAITPIGHDIESFWSAACRGVSGTRRLVGIEEDRLEARVAAQVVDFDTDAVLRKKDRRHLPRAAPLGIAAASQALESAGLLENGAYAGPPEDASVVIGSGGGGLSFAVEQLGLYYRDQVKKASVYVIPAATPGTLSSEISTAFGMHGMSHVLSNGCTSSTDALGYAFRHIRHGTADVVLSGGTDATISHPILMGFELMKIMSTGFNEQPEAASRPFDSRRDGFVLGEGAWMLVLEELEHARRRAVPILAEVLGYGATCEAYHRVRLQDDGVEPARAMTLALEEAGLPAEAVDYVSLHGTATRLNDVVETRAMKRALGEHARTIPMSALKSMIGHPQGASGAAGVVAALLSMRDGFVHPTINLEQPDPECDLDYVARQGRRHTVDVALCNCIGFGSKNAALVLRRWRDA
ncbi:MAG: beta-ketoacyl-[acyl-carrier-protein] synthase family protein [Acidobacteria bacterium]|nr:MAG: beta-ketoacyl-[acyl-carrier-protein] synthase family protein [Acidobacteriota bacterium]